jgi:hemolysin activation/secretion protein
VLAQSVSPSPPSREEVNPQAPQSQPRPSSAQVDEKGAFAPGPCPLSESDVRAAITEVRFTAPGGGMLAPDLADLLADITTSPAEQPIRVVCELRDQANARLRQARYVASVQIPPQRIDEGSLRLEVVAGKIVEVRVRGDAGPYEDILKSRIESLKALDPLNARDAERILLLADDLPGLNVQLGLSPNGGGKQGELVGDLTVTYQRFAVVGNVQNYNGKQLGRETAYLRAEVLGLLGLGDKTFVAASSSFDFKEQKIFQVGHSLALNGKGLGLSATGTIAFSRPSLKDLDLRTTSLIGNIEVSQQLIRSVQTNLMAAVGFEYAQQRTRIYTSGTNFPLNRDKISTIYARVNANTRKFKFDGSQAFSLAGGLELRKGIGAFGANKVGAISGGYAPSRFEGDARAFIVRGDVAGTIGLGPIFELAASGRGQWSNKPLLNYDEFALGNLTLGRGYDPGSNTADRMFGGTLEARANVVNGRNVRAQLYGFYDAVRLLNLDTGSTEARRFIASVGGGARLTLFNSMRLDVTYAHPLDPPLLTGVNIKRAPDRIMASLTAQIIPFGASR